MLKNVPPSGFYWVRVVTWLPDVWTIVSVYNEEDKTVIYMIGSELPELRSYEDDEVEWGPKLEKPKVSNDKTVKFPEDQFMVLCNLFQLMAVAGLKLHGTGSAIPTDDQISAIWCTLRDTALSNLVKK